MVLTRHLRRVGAIGLVAVAVFCPGVNVALAGGHSRTVTYYSAPVVPVATVPVAAMPMTLVPVSTGHWHHHRTTAVGAVMMAPANYGWSGQPGMAAAPSGFGAMPSYGAMPSFGAAPTYGYGAVGYSATPTYTYSYPGAAPATPGAGFGASRTGVSAEINAMASNPRYQALASYMGNDITRVHALRSSLLDSFRKILQQNNGVAPPQNWLETLLMDSAQEFLSFTPYGPLFNQAKPFIQDLIGDVINQGRQTLNLPNNPANPLIPTLPGVPASGTPFTFQVTGVTIQGVFTTNGTPGAPPQGGAPTLPQALQGVPTDPRGAAPPTN